MIRKRKRTDSHHVHRKFLFGNRKSKLTWGILLLLGVAVIVFSPRNGRANESSLSIVASSLWQLPSPTGISSATATRQATQKVYDIVSTIPNQNPPKFTFLDFLDMSITNDTTTATRTKPYNIVPRPNYRTLNDAHLEGLVHTGVWIHVTATTTNADSNVQVLLLKRGPQLVTCPNMWGLVGEHTNGNETPRETVQRALMEELWSDESHDNIAALVHSRVAFVRPITPRPVYYVRDYGPGHENRVDRQITYLYEVRMRHTRDQVILRLDDEVADHQWISLKSYREWMQRDVAAATTSTSSGTSLQKDEYYAQDFCHSTILRLGLFSLERLTSAEHDMPVLT